MGWISDKNELIAKLPNGDDGKVLVDSSGLPTGILIDAPMFEMLKVIPKPTSRQMRRHLLKAMQMFNRMGFTHIRDMTCSKSQWEEAVHLESSGLLTLAVEQFFDAEDPHFFDSALALAVEAKRDETKQIRVKGVKIFFDGALGSEGAFISHPYTSGSGRGLQLITPELVREFCQRVWQNKLEIAIHVIGDEAVHQTVSAVLELHDKGISGPLHLEHVEMLRPETLQMMKSLDLNCHLQPCHWLSDHSWLEEKLGDLKSHVFPWRALQEAGVNFDFGSDSPIEASSVTANLQALEESAAAGVPKLLGDAVHYHSHRDHGWIPNSYSVFENGAATQVVFNGQHLF